MKCLFLVLLISVTENQAMHESIFIPLHNIVIDFFIGTSAVSSYLNWSFFLLVILETVELNNQLNLI